MQFSEQLDALVKKIDAQNDTDLISELEQDFENMTSDEWIEDDSVC
jgi:hypothetical protein